MSITYIYIYYIYTSLNRKTVRPLTEWMPWKWMTTSVIVVTSQWKASFPKVQ